MDEAKVERYLGIIGKQTFVTYYELLADFDLPDNEIADVIASELDCTFDNAMSWRVEPARAVIRAGKARTALQMVITQRASELVLATASK